MAPVAWPSLLLSGGMTLAPMGWRLRPDDSGRVRDLLRRRQLVEDFCDGGRRRAEGRQKATLRHLAR